VYALGVVNVPRQSSKKSPSKKSKYRGWYPSRNFLEKYCVPIKSTMLLEGNVFDDIDEWATGRWGYKTGTYYFEKEEDSLVFRLKYPT
jgi:hypothetical protein